ncbi:MAG TPA: hypothetical protein DD614_00930 [Clostridiales bacterium]|nr:hypothetical protein [Clostridiales bacterium]
MAKKTNTETTLHEDTKSSCKLTKKNKIILSSVIVGVILLGVILTIILVNIKRFSLKPTDEINFNSHTQLVEINFGAETSAVGTVYNNGAQIIKNNSTLKQGIFSYKQNKKIVDTIYDNVTVINTGGSYSKTYFKLKNSGSTTFEIVDENGIKVDFLNSVETSLEGGVFEIKPVANIKAKTINLSERNQKIKTKINNKYHDKTIVVKSIAFDQSYSDFDGYYNDNLDGYETWKITDENDVTYTNLYKIKDGKHVLIQTLDNQLGVTVDSKQFMLEFLNDGTPIFINIREIKFESQTQGYEYDIYDINFNLKGTAKIEASLIDDGKQFRIGNSIFIQEIKPATEDKYDFSSINSVLGTTSYYTIDTYKFSLKNGSFDKVNFDFVINNVSANFNVDTVLLSVTNIKAKKLDATNIKLVNERLQTKQINYEFNEIIKVNNDRYITSTDGTRNFNLIDKNYNLICPLNNFNNVFATNDSIIVQDSNSTYICNQNGIVIDKMANENFVYLNDYKYYIRKETSTNYGTTTTHYYLEQLGLTQEEPIITKTTSGDKFKGTEYQSVNLYTISPSTTADNSNIKATIVVCIQKINDTNYTYKIYNIGGDLLGSFADAYNGHTPNHFYSNDDFVVLSIGTHVFMLNR